MVGWSLRREVILNNIATYCDLANIDANDVKACPGGGCNFHGIDDARPQGIVRANAPKLA